MKRFVLAVLAMIVLTLPSWAGQRGVAEPDDAWLGVYTQTVDGDLKEAFHLESDRGVVVNFVIEDSPADKAGLRQGDVILEFDGAVLSSSEQLSELVLSRRPGDKIRLEVLRDGSSLSLEATIGKRDDDMLLRRFSATPTMPKYYSKSFTQTHSSLRDMYIGLSLESMGKQLAEYFGVTDGKGVLVTEVTPDSPSEQAGLKAGDVITAVDGREVADPSDVREAVDAKEKGEEVTLAVIRNRGRLEMAVEVAENPEPAYVMPNIKLPDLDNDFYMFGPRMKGLFHGDFNQEVEDYKSMQESIEQLKEQMKKMEEQLKEMQEKPDR